MRRLVIDRDYLIQMATSIDFYIAVPAFLFLKEAAMASWDMAKSKRKGCCNNDWQHMRGVIDAWFMKIRLLIEEKDTATLEAIKQWLGDRKGYQVSKCVLYYRRSKEQTAIAKLEF